MTTVRSIGVSGWPAHADLGVLAFTSALRAGRPRTAGSPVALEGVVSIGLGGRALAWPFLPRTLFVVLVAWGLLTSVLEIVAALPASRGHAARLGAPS